MCMHSFSVIALRLPLIKEKSNFFQFARGEVEVLNEQNCPACADRLLLLRRDTEGRILQLDWELSGCQNTFYCVSSRQVLL